MTARDEFRAAIEAAGLPAPDTIIGDGQFHRFSTNGKPSDKTGVYLFHDDERPAGWFKCHRSGIESKWRADIRREFTPEERRQWAARMRELERQREEAIAAARAEAAAKAADLWQRGHQCNGHAYLRRKQISGIAARELDGEILVPMRHGPGALVGLQRIQQDGTKRFIAGTPADGAYHVIGKPAATGPVVIVEGYATGESVHMATGWCVVVAFNAGNLAPVARKIRAALPQAQIIIGADDDAGTAGRIGRNPGIDAATDAARQIGATIAVPLWAGDRGTGTDFNDLHQSEGLDAVRACFDDPRSPDPEPPADDPFDGPDEPPAPATALARNEHTEVLPAVSDEWAPNCSDDQLAARHLQRMQQLTLWCEMWGRWLVWQGNRWVRDETLMVQDQVRQTLREIANTIASDPKLKNAERQAERIASYRTLQAVERTARTYRHVATHPDEWDADLWALNTPGGVVDLRTGAMRPHHVSDRFTKITSVTPGGQCPTWQQFLDRATGGNTELQAFLKRMCGYALTGEIREHALFFVYGTGGNGKGTFLNTITHIMGDYQRVSGAETFTESPGDRHTTELARLQGARLVTAQETEEGKRWAESRIKALTGGDPITARFMRQDDFTYMPQFKLVIVGNHKPSFRNVDEAIRRRLHLIPFTANIPASERDPLLPQKLKAEAGGILAWMIEGCTEWAIHGLNPPSVVKESTEQYLGSEDSLQQWLDECCDLGTGFATSKALFASWSAWCEASGEFVGTMKRLMAKLESRGITTGHKWRGERGCLGITIKQSEDKPW